MAAIANKSGSSPAEALRQEFHAQLRDSIYGQRLANGSLRFKEIDGRTYPVMSNADSHNQVSVVLSAGVADRLEVPLRPVAETGSSLGSAFELATRNFIDESLVLTRHLQARTLYTTEGRGIAGFAQFAHLDEIQKRVQGDAQLEAALGSDYLVKPDVLVAFDPLPDRTLDANGVGVGFHIAHSTPMRKENSGLPILHATVSCKWTMRRDRAQNTRLEALNLVRNRKGRLPHVLAVTMESDPEILSSLCLGTGDIDCVYHGALYELVDACHDAPNAHSGKAWPKVRDSLDRMIYGNRLRDVSDLPYDLLI